MTLAHKGPRPERIYWLDSLKAVGIFLVIFGHLLPETPLKQYIYSFHVPLFFFVSGYLFDRSKYDFRQLLSRRVRTIVVPYFVFAAVSFLFWLLVVRRLSVRGQALDIDPIDPLIGIFYGVGVEPWCDPLNIALWFLPCLFVVEMIFYWVRSKYLLLVFAVLGWAVTWLPFRLPWSLDVAMAAVVFYGLGYYYKDRWIGWKLLPLLLVLNVGCFLLNSPVDVDHLEYGNPAFFYVAAYSGVLFYATLCKLLGRNRVLGYVGRNTIVLIGLAGITWFVMRGAWYAVFREHLEPTDVASLLLISAAQILLTVPAMYAINRWCPWLLGRRSSRPVLQDNAD